MLAEGKGDDLSTKSVKNGRKEAESSSHLVCTLEEIRSLVEEGEQLRLNLVELGQLNALLKFGQSVYDKIDSLFSPRPSHMSLQRALQEIRSSVKRALDGCRLSSRVSSLPSSPSKPVLPFLPLFAATSSPSSGRDQPSALKENTPGIIKRTDIPVPPYPSSPEINSIGESQAKRRKTKHETPEKTIPAEKKDKGGARITPEASGDKEGEEYTEDLTRICFCLEPYDPSVASLRCLTCVRLYHGRCVSVTRTKITKAKETYECPACCEEEGIPYAFKTCVWKFPLRGFADLEKFLQAMDKELALPIGPGVDRARRRDCVRLSELDLLDEVFSMALELKKRLSAWIYAPYRYQKVGRASSAEVKSVEEAQTGSSVKLPSLADPVILPPSRKKFDRAVRYLYELKFSLPELQPLVSPLHWANKISWLADVKARKSAAEPPVDLRVYEQSIAKAERIDFDVHKAVKGAFPEGHPAKGMNLAMAPGETCAYAQLDRGQHALREVKSVVQKVQSLKKSVTRALDEGWDAEKVEKAQLLPLMESFEKTYHISVPELEDLKENIQPLCLCRRPYVADELMICCENCEEWYHPKCVKLTEKQVKTLGDDWLCPPCQDK